MLSVFLNNKEKLFIKGTFFALSPFLFSIGKISLFSVPLYTYAIFCFFASYKLQTKSFNADLRRRFYSLKQVLDPISSLILLFVIYKSKTDFAIFAFCSSIMIFIDSLIYLLEIKYPFCSKYFSIHFGEYGIKRSVSIPSIISVAMTILFYILFALRSFSII